MNRNNILVGILLVCLLIAIGVLGVSAAKKAGNLERTTNSSRLQYEIIEIASCEYIRYNSVDPIGGTGETRIVHKANCENPYHQKDK